MLPRLKGARSCVLQSILRVGRCSLALPGAGEDSGAIASVHRDDRTEHLLRDGSEVAIEIKGGLMVDERAGHGVVTFRQRCAKRVLLPLRVERDHDRPRLRLEEGVRPFTCPRCGNYREVVARHYDPNRQRACIRSGRRVASLETLVDAPLLRGDFGTDSPRMGRTIVH